MKVGIALNMLTQEGRPDAAVLADHLALGDLAEPLGFDPSLWAKVEAMGLTTITVPENGGGGGSGFVELALVAEHAFGALKAPILRVAR